MLVYQRVPESELGDLVGAAPGYILRIILAHLRYDA